MFSRAVKNNAINGSCVVPTSPVATTITSANISDARRLFGRYINRVYQDEGFGQIPLVPAPSKDSFSVPQYRSLTMVRDAVNLANIGVPVLPATKFTSQLLPSSQGGPRGYEAMYPHIQVVAGAQPQKVILADDIVTTGGMLLAAEARLVEAGFEVVAAIACAKTTNSPEPAFEKRSFDLVHDPGLF